MVHHYEINPMQLVKQKVLDNDSNHTYDRKPDNGSGLHQSILLDSNVASQLGGRLGNVTGHASVHDEDQNLLARHDIPTEMKGALSTEDSPIAEIDSMNVPTVV